MDKGRNTQDNKPGGSSFNGERLRKLQLERARSSLSSVSKEAARQDAYRRWSSMNETAVADKQNEATRFGSASTTPCIGAHYSRPKYPVVYVLPDPKKRAQEETLLQVASNRLPNNKFGLYEEEEEEEEEEEAETRKCELKYPHGMPRWGPVTRAATLEEEEEATTSNTKAVSSRNADANRKPPKNRPAPDEEAMASNTERDPKPCNNSSSQAKRRPKHKKKTRQTMEKAKAQSKLAAARAIQNIAAASPKNCLPKKKIAETDLGSRLFGKPSLLQSARIQQARVIHASDSVRQAHSVDEQASVESVQDDEAGHPVEVETVEFESDTNDSYVASLLDEESVSSSASEGDVPNTAKSLRSPPQSTPTKTASFGSRLFGARPKASLLQSARTQQVRVLKANSQRCQAHSLGDPIHQAQQDPKACARSVQSFDEFLDTQTSKQPRSIQSFEVLETPESTRKPIEVETVESIIIEEECDDASLSTDESASALESEQDQDIHATAESQSWSMRSSSDAELSIDETIEDSAGSVKQEESPSTEPESEDLSKPHRTPQNLSIPAMILSEVDAESRSRHSDYSSLAINMGKDAGTTEEEDEFFDAIDCCRASRDRPFDAGRCRELMQLRNKYLEQEGQRKLLSPEAASRLSSIPSLSRNADEMTLLELATRWHQANQQPPAPTESLISSPFSGVRQAGQEPPLASMPDDGPNVQPIALVAPTTIPKQAVTRKEPWHVATSKEYHHNGDNIDKHTTETPAGSAPKTTTPFRARARRFLLRCLYLILFLLWVARASVRLRELFAPETTSGYDASTWREEVVAMGNLLVDDLVSCANASNRLLRPGGTPSEWTNMPIILYDPPPAAVEIPPANNEQDAPLLLPQKCFANLTRTKKKFWEHIRFDVQDTDDGKATDSIQYVESGAIEVSHNPLEGMFIVAIGQDQTFCDDAFEMCYTKPESPPEVYVEAVEFDLEMTPHESESKPPLLKSLGDMLRKRGRELQEQRRRRRQILHV